MPDLRFEALASSSAGNLYVVDDGQTRILLECGVTRKKMKKLTEFATFNACLVTHEHNDHAKCVRDIIKDGTPVYMSCGTAEALELDMVETVEHMEQFTVGTFDIVPFTTFHDAAEPLGWLIKSKVDGDVLAFATDTVNLRYQFPGINILAIEANYDKNILAECTRMPESVRHRITNSHMEIDVLCDYLQTLDLSQCREIYLLHLSDSTSHEGHFVNKVARAVPEGIKITPCPKEVKQC